MWSAPRPDLEVLPEIPLSQHLFLTKNFCADEFINMNLSM
ncbi:MAG: hypothetical protein ACJARR_003052 [Pseudophaeobacter arcticus]|jgi:hypothetical protein